MSTNNNDNEKILSGSSLTQYLKKGPQNISELLGYLETLKNCWLNPKLTSIHQANSTILDIFLTNLLQSCTKGDIENWSIDRDEGEGINWCLQPEFWDILLFLLNWQGFNFNGEDSIQSSLGPNNEIDLEKFKLMLNKHHLMLPILGGIKFINFKLVEDINNWAELKALAGYLDYTLKAYFNWMSFNNMSLPKTAPFYGISKLPHFDLVNSLISTISITLKSNINLEESDLATLLSLMDSGLNLLTKMVKWEENYKLIFNQIIEHLINPIVELFYYLNTSNLANIGQSLENFKTNIRLVFFPSDQLNGYRHAIEIENDTNELSYHSKLFDKLEANISLASNDKILKLGSIQSLPIWLELFCKEPSSEADHIKALKIPLAFKLIKMTYPYLKIEELFSDYKVTAEMPRKRVKKSSQDTIDSVTDQLEYINQSINSTSKIIKICKDKNLFTNTLGVTQLVDRDALLAEFIEFITNIQLASTSQLYNLPSSNQLSICLNSCLISYANLINLNPILFERKLKELWDLALVSKYEGSLELGISLINNYTRIRKLDNCISALVKSLGDIKLLDKNNHVIIFDKKFIDNLYTILNELTNIHQLEGILEPITTELISRLKGEKLDTGLPHQLHIVSQLTHIWSIIIISFDKSEVKKHLLGHFNKFIEEIFLPTFKWDELKDEDHCKKKLKKISTLFQADKTDINFINILQLLSLTLTINSESLTSYVTIKHFYNLVKEIGKKINLNKNKLGKLILLKLIIQFSDLILIEGFKDEVLVDIFNFILSQLPSNYSINKENNSEPILLNNLESNYNEAIWNQLTCKVSWVTIYSGLTSSRSSESEGIVDSLAKSILNRQLLFNFNGTKFTEYQLEGDNLSFYWLNHWLKVIQEGLIYYRENFNQEVFKLETYKHETLNWLNLDTLDLSNIKELLDNISQAKLNNDLIPDQIKFLSLMFTNLRKIPPNLITEGVKIKLIKLIHIILVFIKVNYTNTNVHEELIELIDILISTLNPIQSSLTKSQAIKLLSFNGFNNLMDCSVSTLPKIKKFSNWYELRNKLTFNFIQTFSILINVQNGQNLSQSDQTILLSLVKPHQFLNESNNTWSEIYRIDLLNNIYNNLNSSFNGGLFQSEVAKVQFKLILNYYGGKLNSKDLELIEKDIEVHLNSLKTIQSDYKLIFDSKGDDLDENELSMFLRDILKEVVFLQRAIYTQFSNKNFKSFENLCKLREYPYLNLLITKMISSLVKWSSFPLISQLLFQSLLSLIQCKFVLFSLNTKLIPASELSPIVNWIQLIYHFANLHTLDPKLISQMSVIGNILGKLMNHEQFETSVTLILHKIGYDFKLDELLSTLQLLNDWLLDDTNNKKNLKVKAIGSTINHLALSILTCIDSNNRQSLTLPSFEFIFNSLGVAKYQLDQNLISSIMQLIQQLLKQELKLNELHQITKVVIRIIKFHFKLIQLTNLQVILVELILNWIILFNLNNWTRVDLVISPILLCLPSKCYTDELAKSYDLVICNILTELIQQRLEFSQVFSSRNSNNTPDFIFEEDYINKNLTSEFEGWFHIFLILETCSNQLNNQVKKDEDLSLKKVLGWISPHGQNLLKMVRSQYVSGVKFKGKV